MAWECVACGHAPHNENHGRGCQRKADKEPACGCLHVTDREAYAEEVMGAHHAPERNPELANRFGQ